MPTRPLIFSVCAVLGSTCVIAKAEPDLRRNERPMRVDAKEIPPPPIAAFVTTGSIQPRQADKSDGKLIGNETNALIKWQSLTDF